MFLIIHSKSPLPIPNEVKSDLFLVIKRWLSPQKLGVRMQQGVKKGGGVGGVTSKG